MVGSATAGILGIVGAASSAIAITAVAFGLATATIDNVTGGLLYELKPSAVRDLVERTRFAYEENLKPDNWQDRPSSFRTIRGYVALCLPAVIEANATSAIRAARPQANRTGGELRGGVPRIGMEAPQATPGAAPALGTRDPVTPTPQAPPAELAGNRVGAGELNVTRAMAIRIQAGLCLPPDKLTGDLTTDTRTALEQFRSFTRKGNTGGMTPQEVVFLSGSRACDPKFFYQSAFERFAFPTAEDIVKYQEDVKKRLGARTPGELHRIRQFRRPDAGSHQAASARRKRCSYRSADGRAYLAALDAGADHVTQDLGSERTLASRASRRSASRGKGLRKRSISENRRRR